MFRRRDRIKKIIALFLPILVLALTLSGCEKKVQEQVTYLENGIPDYSGMRTWAWFSEGEGKEADLFFIGPTVDTGEAGNMSMENQKRRDAFVSSLNMERGLYEEVTRMYAPFYRQATIGVYSLSAEDREPYLQKAYGDVSAAFAWYLEHENDGRPIILAGFSQGADFCYRLLEEYFYDPKLQSQLVAVYAIGWPCTEEMVESYPQIKPASGATDTGVVVFFECEAEDVDDTVICPAGQKAYGINPLNWRTDETPAEASLNLGACFTDGEGSITSEIPQFCGAYLDTERGALKVPGVSSETYPPALSIFPEGCFHVYDYMFFFRNVQENVKVRLNAYLSED